MSSDPPGDTDRLHLDCSLAMPLQHRSRIARQTRFNCRVKQRLPILRFNDCTIDPVLLTACAPSIPVKAEPELHVTRVSRSLGEHLLVAARSSLGEDLNEIGEGSEREPPAEAQVVPDSALG